MPRYLAICNVPGVNEQALRRVLPGKRTSEWRPDPRTTILKVVAASGAGVVVVEGEATEQGPFEEWLKKAGWQAHGIHQVDLVAQGPNFWKV